MVHGSTFRTQRLSGLQRNETEAAVKFAPGSCLTWGASSMALTGGIVTLVCEACHSRSQPLSASLRCPASH
jgi:hypothetical protein